MASNDTSLLASVDADGIAAVAFNRPQKRNAVSLAMWTRLKEIFTDYTDRADVRVVILTGTGGHFSSGADISEFATVRADAASGAAYEREGELALRAVLDCPKPTIAQISGVAVGGGCGLALACDLRVADRTARLGIPAGKLGIVYSTLDCAMLLRAVGLANAKRVLYTAEIFDAGAAHALGLVDILSEGDVAATARELAMRCAATAPLSAAGHKLILNAIAGGEAQARASEIAAVLDRAFDSEDYREGRRAFMEKRPPVFKGR
jgi:enoyl-CoA hydratase/carnithine racemase